MTLKQRMRQYRKFKAFLGPDVYRLFVAAAAVGVLAFVVEASFVLISQGFLNALGLVTESQLKLPDFYPRGIFASVAFLFFFGLIRSAVLGTQNFLSNYTSQAFAVQQRKQLFAFGLRNADKISTTELISTFGDRVKEASIVLQHCSMMIGFITSSSLLFLAGLRLAPAQLLIGMAFLGLLVIPLSRATRAIAREGKAVVKDWDDTNRTLITGLKNFFLLKIYKQVDKQIVLGNQSLDTYLSRFRKYMRMAATQSATPGAAGIFIISTLVLVSRKYYPVEPVFLLAFFYIFVRICQSLGVLSFSYSSLRFNFPSFKALYHWHTQYLQHDERRQALSGRTTHLALGPVTIELKNVSFAYATGEAHVGASHWVIRDRSLVIAPGTPLIIKGPSGSGKSTLLKLILGVEDPQRGEVLLNAAPVTQVDEKFWDRASYVGPEPFLIEGSLRDNLLYGHPTPNSVSESKIEKALRQAQLWGEVVHDVAQLEQMLADHAELSTGQRQRLSIARALLRDADLYILDEATANLDRESEAKIIEAMKPLFLEKTCLVVTHKESFDGLGKVLEMGSKMETT